MDLVCSGKRGKEDRKEGRKQRGRRWGGEEGKTRGRERREEGKNKGKKERGTEREGGKEGRNGRKKGGRREEESLRLMGTLGPEPRSVPLHIHVTALTRSIFTLAQLKVSRSRRTK